MRLNYRLLLAATLGHLIVDVHQGALPVLLPVLQDRYELSYALTTSLVLVLHIASSLLQPTIGLLSDRLAFRWLVPIGCLLTGLGFLFFMGGSYRTAVLGTFICGVGIAAFHPEGSKLAYHASGERKAWALSVFTLGGNLGTAIGPLVMGFLLLNYGMSGVLGLLLIAVPGAALFAWMTPGLYASLSPPKELASRQAGDTTARTGPMMPMVLLLAMIVLRAWAHSSTLTFIPLYYGSHLGIGAHVSGVLLTIYLTAGAIGSVVAGLIADRWGGRATMVATLALGTVLLRGFPHVTGSWTYVVVALMGLVMVSTFGVTTALGQQMFPDRLGLASGLVLGATVGTGGFGAVMLGSMADRWGIESALTAIPLFALLATGCAVALSMWYRRFAVDRVKEPQSAASG